MAKNTIKNPGKIIRDDNGNPILDKNGNYVYMPQSGRIDATMAPYEYFMALPENAVGDLVFKGASKLISPLMKPIASKAIHRVGEFGESKYNNALNRFKKDIYRENAPNYSTKETNDVINSIKDRLKTKEGINRLKNLNRENFNIDDIKLIKDNTDYGYSTKTILGKNIIGLNENLPKDAIGKVLRHELEHDLQNGSKTNIDNLLEKLELRRTPEQLPNDGYKTIIKNENVPGYDIYDKLLNKKKSTDYFYSGSGGLEKSPMLGELQQYLIDNKLISHPYAVSEITPDKIREVFTDRMFKEGDYPLRIFDIMKPTENNYKLISEGLNKMISTVPVGLGLGAYKLNENNNDMNEYKSGGWIQKAVNPKHRGFCSPMTKSTCTPRRKAFAMTMKKHHGFHADGGELDPYLQYYDAQSLYTKVLQNKYPKVPINEILETSAKDKSFKHDKLEEVADSLRSKYGDISLTKDEITGLINAGYPDILGLNSKIQSLDSEISDKKINTTGKNEPKSESFGYRMMLQRSYPKGKTPYKYLENKMFLGGDTHDNTNSNMVGGAAQLGFGVATGEPGSIISGATGFVSGNIKNMSTVLKDKDSSLLEKGLSLVSPIAGGIFANQARDREEQWNENNNLIKERNKMFNIKAKGGIIAPLGVSNNMMMNYAEGGQLTEFNNGGSHEVNPIGGIPQGIDNQGNPNLVEEGETKFNDYIFSDRLMLDKDTVAEHNLPKSMEGKTFAEASKKLNKLYKERPNDFITKSTAKDYLTRLTAANDKAKSIDEANNVMAYGGNVYAGGAPLKLKTNPHVQIDDPMYYEGTPSYMNSIKPTLGIQNVMQLENKLTSRVKDNSKALAENSTDLGFFRDSKNLRYAPIAFDVLASTGLLGKTPTPKTVSPTLVQNQGMLSPQAIDEMQTRKAIDEAYQTGVSGLSESAGGSGSALRAGLSGLTSDYISGIGKSFADVNRANIAQKQAADQFNLQTQGNLAAQNAQLMNQTNLYNNQLLNAKAQADYENRMSYLGKAAEGLGDIGYESRLGEILPRIYGYDQYGNYVAPLSKKACGGRLRLKNYKK